LVLGITGASGVVYAIRLLQLAQQHPDFETHLVISPAGARTIEQETDLTAADVHKLATVSYRYKDIGAAPASGSGRMDAMAVLPCSMRTMSSIACGTGDDLITRAADVMLKERRPLVVAPREAPMHVGHLRNLVRLAEMGAIVFPPVPAFYQRPQGLEDLVDHTVFRLLDQLRLPGADYWSPQWKGVPAAADRQSSQTAQEGGCSPDEGWTGGVAHEVSPTR